MVKTLIKISEEVTNPIHIKHYLNLLFDDEKWVSFEPETIWYELKPRCDLTPELKNKINAIKTVLAGNLPLVNPFIFEKVITSFNNLELEAETWTPCTPFHYGYGVRCIKDLKPDEEYDEDIITYLQGAISFGGIWGFLSYPKDLQFARPSEKNFYKKELRDLIKEVNDHVDKKKKATSEIAKFHINLAEEVDQDIQTRYLEGDNFKWLPRQEA